MKEYSEEEKREKNIAYKRLIQTLDILSLNSSLSYRIALGNGMDSIVEIWKRCGAPFQELINEVDKAPMDEFRSYIEASDIQARRFQGIYLMMNYPGMCPYLRAGYGRSDGVGELNNYRDNWWGRYYVSREEERQSLDGLRVDRHPSEFLSEAQRQEAEKEWNLLGECQQSFSIFTSEAVKWTKIHPNDPRSPEALYLAIRASRYSAAVTSDSSNAKPAFVLLHKKYPGSSWAKKAPYWFN